MLLWAYYMEKVAMIQCKITYLYIIDFIFSEWIELTPEQEKYLIQVRGPQDIFQYIIRDLVFATNITNAAVLFDDEFGESFIIYN